MSGKHSKFMRAIARERARCHLTILQDIRTWAFERAPGTAILDMAILTPLPDIKDEVELMDVNEINQLWGIDTRTGIPLSQPPREKEPRRFRPFDIFTPYEPDSDSDEESDSSEEDFSGEELSGEESLESDPEEQEEDSSSKSCMEDDQLEEGTTEWFADTTTDTMGAEFGGASQSDVYEDGVDDDTTSWIPDIAADANSTFTESNSATCAITSDFKAPTAPKLLLMRPRDIIPTSDHLLGKPLGPITGEQLVLLASEINRVDDIYLRIGWHMQTQYERDKLRAAIWHDAIVNGRDPRESKIAAHGGSKLRYVQCMDDMVRRQKTKRYKW